MRGGGGAIVGDILGGNWGNILISIVLLLVIVFIAYAIYKTTRK